MKTYLIKKSQVLFIIVQIILSNYGLIMPNYAQKAPINYEELAYYWAPIWYQDTVSNNYPADYITNFDFDGDWAGNNNWENLDNNKTYGYVYYSVVETNTHWFLGYYDFHPRDWEKIDTSLLSHENDMEGVLLVIQKDDHYGKFLCMVTEAHSEIYQYTDQDAAPSNQIKEGQESIDGDVAFENSIDYQISVPFTDDTHPIVYVEGMRHGVHGADRWESEGFPENDGVIYRPSGLAEEPESGNDRDVGYELLSIDILWEKRLGPYGSGYAFENFNRFDGDTYGQDKALAPWGWDDGNDGPTFAGEIFYNPLDLTNVYFDDLGDYSFIYTYNPYVLIVQLDAYRINWQTDAGKTVDGYFNLFLFDGQGNYKHTNYGDSVLDGDSGIQYSWRENLYTNQWYVLHEQIPRPFYGINYPSKPFFGIRSKDWNTIVKDDWLMEEEDTYWYGGQNVSTFESRPVRNISEGENQYLDWIGSEANITLLIEPTSTITLPEFNVTVVLPRNINLILFIVGLTGGVVLLTILVIIAHKRRKARKKE
ncbi:MAG: hypothetical protein U9O98_07875 [Asgard group archaeon]|nr:hypothetical protein [Asgard group archaeon]